MVLIFLVCPILKHTSSPSTWVSKKLFLKFFIMKKRAILLSFIYLLFAAGCKKESLSIINPNAPTGASLLTESGIKSFALGIIQQQIGNVTNAGTVNLFMVALTHHSTMADEIIMSAGNFGGRWANQVYSVTPPLTGVPVVNPFGVTQLTSLKGFNSREAGDRNVFLYEWFWAYNYIGQCNQLLTALDNPALAFSGDAVTKKAILKAWALWWKGYACSRLGSIYIAGLIVNTAGITSHDYVSNTAIIEAANKTLDTAATVLNSITANADYEETYKAITASYNSPDDIITPEMWIHTINTIKARNIIANKKNTAMTATDWNAVMALTENGISAADNVFKFGMTADGVNDVSGNFFHPYALIGTGNEFTYVSERLIQEYKTGDARLAANFTLQPLSDRAPPNMRSRGLQFGTRWSVNNVEDGGKFATNNNAGSAALAGSYEENALMAAEALINTGQVENGLAIVDEVRTAQGAGVAAVAGTGLTQAQANTELRRERRVALFLRGTAFYDARRWGITAPVADGGGRTGALVYLPAALLGGGATEPDVRPCIMDYRYVDYFDVPLNELDFNAPSSIAVPVKN
jgi:starch-binding outer membrane protein, SusD/RagB family